MPTSRPFGWASSSLLAVSRCGEGAPASHSSDSRAAPRSHRLAGQVPAALANTTHYAHLRPSQRAALRSSAPALQSGPSATRLQGTLPNRPKRREFPAHLAGGSLLRGRAGRFCSFAASVAANRQADRGSTGRGCLVGGGRLLRRSRGSRGRRGRDRCTGRWRAGRLLGGVLGRVRFGVRVGRVCARQEGCRRLGAASAAT